MRDPFSRHVGDEGESGIPWLRQLAAKPQQLNTHTAKEDIDTERERPQKRNDWAEVFILEKL